MKNYACPYMHVELHVDVQCNAHKESYKQFNLI